ncbi:MAG: thermonuclease family protein [Alphaproteobacteria bacterium]
MRPIFFVCLFVLLLPAGLPVAAQEILREGQGVVREVTDGDTLSLDTGAVVRLTGIQAPKLALGRPGFKPWPLADEARNALQAMTQNRTVQLGFGGARADRHRRTLAHLYRQPDGLWIQGEMLRLGLARVYSFSDNRALVPEMLALEQMARTARRGVWAHEFYRVRTPEGLGGLLDSFQLVQGRVLKFAKISDYVFLNFGMDYKTDFTAVIGRRDWRRFAAAAIDPQNYTGRTLRVRGWLEHWNGPMLRISHPEQIEVLE